MRNAGDFSDLSGFRVGRTREESSYGLEDRDGKALVRILDPAANTEYYLDMAARIAYSINTPDPPRVGPATARNIPEPPNPSISEKTESLGTHS